MTLQVRKITDRLFVATQLRSEDIAGLKAQGFQTIINNRPDDEIIGQPKSSDLAASAKQLGLSYFALPVDGGNISDTEIEAFDNIIETQNGPILAFCRTGTRCATLWALSEADNSTPSAIIERAREAGYDLSGLRQRIASRRSRLTMKTHTGTGL